MFTLNSYKGKQYLKLFPILIALLFSYQIVAQQTSEKTTFFRAAREGNNDFIKSILKDKPDLINASGFMGTALHMTALSGHLKTTRLLIESGAKLNIQDGRGWTAMHYAAMMENTDIIRLLIKSGADINLTNNSGQTPLHVTIRAVNNKTQVAVIASILINNDATINTIDNKGDSPLIDAIKSGYTNLVNQMIKKEGDLKELIKSKPELIFNASIRGYSGIVKLLVDHGAKYNQTDSLGNTPLHYAAKHGNKKVVEVLIKAGSNENIKEANFKIGEYLNKKINAEQAYIWYLNHRGMAIKTKNHFFVFDDEITGVPPDRPSLANGSLSAQEIVNDNVISFYTCWHGRANEGSYIHNIEDSIINISHILNKIDLYRGSDKCNYMSPGDKLVIRDVVIHSLFSEQMTLSYIIKTDGLKIFYSGFVNDKKTVENEFKSFKGKLDNFDIVFISVTGMDSDIESYYEWAEAIINNLNPKMIIPTGMSYYTEKFARFKQYINNKYPGIAVNYGRNPGDRLIYN